jgi:hypothetical protein
MKKGIYLGNGLTIKDAEGLDFIIIASDTFEIMDSKITEAVRAGITNIYLWISVAKYFQGMASKEAYWRKIVEYYSDNLFIKGYYLDEPYSVLHLDNNQISYMRDVIRTIEHCKDFIIGDIREIIKSDYKPIPNVHYAYTSYVDTLFIFGKPLKFGLPDQSSAIKRLHKKVNGKISFVWMYGQNKIGCHPDEYKSLFRTCKKLGIDKAVIYFGDGVGNGYKNNSVSTHEAGRNLLFFKIEKNPYNFLSWIMKFLERLIFIIGNGFKEN